MTTQTSRKSLFADLGDRIKNDPSVKRNAIRTLYGIGAGLLSAPSPAFSGLVVFPPSIMALNHYGTFPTRSDRTIGLGAYSFGFGLGQLAYHASRYF